MVAWANRKAWSDRFIPEIKRILGEHLIQVPDIAEDRLRNTDLITFCMPGEVRIACRVRKYRYLQKYPDEFTLRCSVPSGRKTELAKLLKGWGDYIFYGFSNPEETDLAAWLIGDLGIFRQWHQQYRATHQRWPGQMKRNPDGSSHFLAFGIHDVDPKFIVARKTLDIPSLN